MASNNLDIINNTLLETNPFPLAQVRAADVWGNDLLDIPTLNKHASDVVFHCLDKIKHNHYSATSILITADVGTGKSHIISRIRHRLQTEGSGLFILANRFDDLNKPQESFQSLLSDSLGNLGSHGVTQWQGLASAIIGEAVQALKPNVKKPEAQNLIYQFQQQPLQKSRNLVEKITKTFCKINPVKDPDIVKSILWTLVPSESSHAAKWLAGKELAQYKAIDLRLPTQNQSFDAVLQILTLMSRYNQLVICFDELDRDNFNDAGFHRAEVTAGLIKDLFQNLSRGIILTVMVSATWTKRVTQNTPKAVWGKVQAQGDPIRLQPLSGDTAIEVTRFFLDKYYTEQNLVPPHSLYPFNTEQIHAIGQTNPTIREFLDWCRLNVVTIVKPVNSAVSPLTVDPLREAFASELEVVSENDLDHNEVIGKALLYNFQQIVEHTVKRVTVKTVTDGVKKNGKKDNYLNFKIIGEEDNQIVCIGVAVLQDDGGRSLGAGFKRLLDDKKQFQLSRGCLVRSKSKQLNKYFQEKYLNPLITKGGEYADLKFDEVKPLLALYSIYQKQGVDYNFSDEELQRFVITKGAEYNLGVHNPLLQEILSDPSYQVPDFEDEPAALEEVDPQEDDSELDQSDVIELSGDAEKN